MVIYDDALRPDLQNTLRQSYDNLTIMQKIRSIYDGRLIHKTSYEEPKKLFFCTIHLQNRKVVGGSVRKFTYRIHEKNFSTLLVTIISRSYDKITIIV